MVSLNSSSPMQNDPKLKRQPVPLTENGPDMQSYREFDKFLLLSRRILFPPIICFAVIRCRIVPFHWPGILIYVQIFGNHNNFACLAVSILKVTTNFLTLGMDFRCKKNQNWSCLLLSKTLRNRLKLWSSAGKIIDNKGNKILKISGRCHFTL